MYWKKNLFLLPTRKFDKLYIDESVKFLNSWVEGTALHNITFKTIMIMLNLLLQKPSKDSKVKDDLTALQRRRESWLKGDLIELLHQGETIQKTQQLTKGDIGRIWKKFAALVRKGNVNATEYEKRNITLEQQNIEPSRTKHPNPKDAPESVMLSTQAVLLVDAASAFNSVIRPVFPHNICIICPPIGTLFRR